MTWTRAGWLLAVVLWPLTWCVVIGELFGSDPMVVVELCVATISVIWLSITLSEVLVGRRVGAALYQDSIEVELFGITCHVRDRKSVV